MNFEILTNRATSAFPISVGTSLALESAIISDKPSIDPERQIPQKIDLSSYEEFWINISTLFRNLFGSLSKEDNKRVGPNELSAALIEEMELIQNLVSTDTYGKTKVVFYICEYKDLQKKYPYALFRQINTDNQKAYKGLHDQAIQLAINHFYKLYGRVAFLRIFNSTLETNQYKSALLISHIAHDLLSSNKFKELDLLESHTGVLKKKHLWYTKYENGKELSMLPFNHILLQLFGDNEHFRAFPIKLRNTIIEIAKKYMWTPASTIDKVKYGLNSLNDQYSLEIIKKLY